MHRGGVLVLTYCVPVTADVVYVCLHWTLTTPLWVRVCSWFIDGKVKSLRVSVTCPSSQTAKLKTYIRGSWPKGRLYPLADTYVYMYIMHSWCRQACLYTFMLFQELLTKLGCVHSLRHVHSLSCVCGFAHRHVQRHIQTLVKLDFQISWFSFFCLVLKVGPITKDHSLSSLAPLSAIYNARVARNCMAELWLSYLWVVPKNIIFNTCWSLLYTHL